MDPICTPIFEGTDRIAYRDPAAIFLDGKCHLFMTESVMENGYMYNRVVHSVSADLRNWSPAVPITPKDNTLNYCSPGSILRVGEKYVLCYCSYPLPKPYRESWIATDDARIFLSETLDFTHFSDPRPLLPKPGIPLSLQGRMIDPFLFRDPADPGVFRLLFKQNGISSAHSTDLVNWTYDGHCEGGENACVIRFRNRFLLIHSPSDGIGFKASDDLHSWEDLGTTFLARDRWDWASGRLTAGFAIPLPAGFGAGFALFFHGSRADCPPETHGAASVAVALTDDFVSFRYL